jgi:hypothetical protein
MTTSRTVRLLRRLHADPAAPPGDGGRWPTTKQGLLWDLLPGHAAPQADGVIAPTHSAPDWVTTADEADLPDLLALERRRADAASASAATTEGKASRLLGTTVTLLAASVALTALQLRTSAHSHGCLRWVLAVAAIPGAAACALLLLSAVRSLDADTRVGIYGNVNGRVRAEHGLRGELERTLLGTAKAEWTAGKKASALMDARAWFTRALLADLVALVLAGLTVALHT